MMTLTEFLYELPNGRWVSLREEIIAIESSISGVVYYQCPIAAVYQKITGKVGLNTFVFEQGKELGLSKKDITTIYRASDCALNLDAEETNFRQRLIERTTQRQLV